jgi:hypothetical protein
LPGSAKIRAVAFDSNLLVAVGEGGAILTSPQLPFTALPSVPLLNTPADSMTNVPTSGITLGWSGSVGAQSYHLQISTDAGLTALIRNDSGITALSAASGALTQGQAYYWRVRAKNDSGVSSWSSTC